MTRSETSSGEALFALRVAARMTGLKPELIRAWETRYEAVRPHRSLGGSRRYSVADLDRLRLLREVVDSGHRIGGVARLSETELRALLPVSDGVGTSLVARAIAAVERLDGLEFKQALDAELPRLGVVDFALEVALPLLRMVGERWEKGELSVAVEHLATNIVRSMLLSELGEGSRVKGSGVPHLLFATPSGERHDVGTLVAAHFAKRVGVGVTFLGADMPTEDLVAAVIDSDAAALVLGIVTLPRSEADASVRDFRMRLPGKHGLWIGGAGIRGIAPVDGVERIDNFGQFEAHATRLDLGGTVARGEQGL